MFDSFWRRFSGLDFRRQRFWTSKNQISFLFIFAILEINKTRLQEIWALSVLQVEKYGGYVPNYRARGEQHYRVPYKEPSRADWGRVDVGKSVEVAVNFEKELLHAKFFGLADEHKCQRDQSVWGHSFFNREKATTKKTWGFNARRDILRSCWTYCSPS